MDGNGIINHSPKSNGKNHCTEQKGAYFCPMKSNNISNIFKLAIVLSLILAINACKSNKTNEINTPGSDSSQTSANPVDSSLFAAIQFTESEFSFGDATQGQVLTHTFTFTNTGKNSLLIQNAVASCGCTVPQWPKEAIAPGDTGKIMVEFNSKNMVGQVKKTVTVTANTLPPTTQVSFTANILEAK